MSNSLFDPASTSFARVIRFSIAGRLLAKAPAISVTPSSGAKLRAVR
jgi:hypothetical protein